MRAFHRFALVLCAAAPIAAACSSDPDIDFTGSSTTTTAHQGGTGGGTGEGAGDLFPAGGTGGTTTGQGDAAGGQTTTGGDTPGPACGDGNLDPGEACDDGNGASGDGCTGTCGAVEQGFVCPTPGQPCLSNVVCGDGKIAGDETCDDQNTTAGDGCNASCHVEPGWTCVVVGVACSAAQCGDSIVAGGEECDDGDASGGDGCSATCQLEPGFKCDVPGAACQPTVCGDGVREGSEQCDDGDHDMGDGCTPFCVKEPNCAQGACTSSCGDGIKLAGGAEQCDDGNTDAGDGCSPSCNVEPGFTCSDQAAPQNQLALPIVLRDFHESHPDMEYTISVDLGIVAQTLGADGKPVYKNAAGTTPTTNGKASFDQWYRDVPGTNFTVLQTLTFNKLPSGEYQYSSSSFFPLTNLGFGNEGNLTNFHFTSEVRYWFEYKGTEQLDFTGDDDVWVFVNKRLAVDLGGVHSAMSGSIFLSAAQAPTFGLQLGKIYEIVVFQAERHTSQSNYKLTLSNFAKAKSTCQSVCGDGVKTPDEACDDGTNDGTYGHCTPDCKPGPFCGDGVVQASDEQCDDGVNLSPYGGCAPGCKLGSFCGDGKVDSLFGEQCDDGSNDGGYGQCDMGCVLGPHCGDGVTQAGQGEECDDGNKDNFDECQNDCTVNVPE